MRFRELKQIMEGLPFGFTMDSLAGSRSHEEDAPFGREGQSQELRWDFDRRVSPGVDDQAPFGETVDPDAGAVTSPGQACERGGAAIRESDKFGEAPCDREAQLRSNTKTNV
jgi:hypothetical protein